MWVSSLAANMGEREHNTWEMMANANPENTQNMQNALLVYYNFIAIHYDKYE